MAQSPGVLTGLRTLADAGGHSAWGYVGKRPDEFPMQVISQQPVSDKPGRSHDCS